MSDEQEEIFEVRVDTGGSARTFETTWKNLFSNIKHGNTEYVYFITTKGDEVFIPIRFMIVVSKKKRELDD